jgi:hypothetical protein
MSITLPQARLPPERLKLHVRDGKHTCKSLQIETILKIFGLYSARPAPRPPILGEQASVTPKIGGRGAVELQEICAYLCSSAAKFLKSSPSTL